ncbi:MAG: DUF790 family protein [Candidatus Promineifilaceae bacterium]
MLKGDLIRPRLQYGVGTVRPRILAADYFWLGEATNLRTIFERNVGKSRAMLMADLRDYEGDKLYYPLLRGLSSVLENRCTYSSNPPVAPVTVRETLFKMLPALGEQRDLQIREAAAQYSVTPQQIEESLFSDLLEEQILQDTGGDIAPINLIDRYNLEVARGILYWAREMRLHVRDNYKDLFKFIKLFKLMNEIQPVDTGGYNITLYGPISPFVKSTIRYGVQFAKFMPALLLCDQWQMEADVRPPGARDIVQYRLDDSTELKTHFKRSGEFDSRLEADFSAEFHAKYTRTQRKWELTREDELVIVGDTVMIPDFTLTNKKDGRKALVEIVGFWHPNYLRRKIRKVQTAGLTNLILLVYESANVSEESFKDVVGEVLFFAKKPMLKKVLDSAERCAL